MYFNNIRGLDCYFLCGLSTGFVFIVYIPVLYHLIFGATNQSRPFQPRVGFLKGTSHLLFAVTLPVPIQDEEKKLT